MKRERELPKEWNKRRTERRRGSKTTGLLCSELWAGKEMRVGVGGGEFLTIINTISLLRPRPIQGDKL